MTDLTAPLMHGMAQLSPELRLHYVSAGNGDRTIVLLHGFPQTWWAWHRVIPILARAGFRVIAPDYRGAGGSSRPADGYDKRSMAGDIHELLQHLGIVHPVVMVGHDIGLMVAYAFADQYRDEASHLVVMDAPLPGTDVFDAIRIDPRVWQFAFHNVRDIPELLIAGREREYIKAFVSARIFDPSAIGEDDFDLYASAYSAAGSMRAALALYRTFDQDAKDNREALRRNGKLKIPVLAVYGAMSNTGSRVEDMMCELAGNVTGRRVDRAGHWIAEENPTAFTGALMDFLTSTARTES